MAVVLYIDPEVEANLQNLRDLFYQMSNGNSRAEIDFEESFNFIKYWCLEKMEETQKNEKAR